jgi:uncharacterized membrane protein
MTSPAPEDNRFEQFSEAIARLFGRIRDIETRLQSLEVHLGDDLVAAAEVVEPISDMPAIDSPQPELNVPVSELPDSSSTVVPTAVPVDSEVEMALASAVNSTRHDGGTGSIDWESLVGGRLLTWTGAFTLVVAVAFFIPWAWQHFDLPPALRVTIFHVIGLGILIGSQALFRGRLATLAGGLAAVGIFTLYAAAWAAQHHYGLWEQGITFVDCVLITTAAIAIALRNNNVGIIVLGALGGYITPFLASSGEANHIILFSYLAFLNVALITCSVLRSWQFLKPLTLAATALMFLLWVENNALGASELWSTQWLAVLHFVIFLLGTTVPPVLWRQSSTPWDRLTLAGSSTALVGLTWRLYHEHPQQQLALVCWGMSLMHLALFAATYQRVTHADRMPRVHLALCALFFTLAAPLQMKDTLEYLAVAWCAQGLVFTLIGIVFRDRQMCTTALLVFALAVIRLAGFDYTAPSQTMGDIGIDRRFFVITLCGVMAMLAGSAYWLLRQREDLTKEDRTWQEAFGSGLLAGGNLAIMLGMLYQWDGRVILPAWILNAAAIWAVGFAWNKPAIRWYALWVAIGMVGTRAVYHGDQMATTYCLLINDRFSSLLLVTALYFTAGWFYRRLKLVAATPAHPTRPRLDVATRPPLAKESSIDVILGLLANVVLINGISLEIRDWYDYAASQGWKPFSDMRMVRLATYSIVWAIYAGLMVAVGFVLKYKLFRIIGLGAFVPILAKVFFIDLASLRLMPRVLALFVLGMMLLGTSLLYQRFAGRLDAQPVGARSESDST